MTAFCYRAMRGTVQGVHAFSPRGNNSRGDVMLLKTATGLTFATACLTAVASLPVHAQMTGPGAPGTEVVTNGPQTSPGDTSTSWSARQNVMQSHQYDRLLETNRGFRQARMRKECGPITDPQLRQQCLSSFRQDEPYAGSSASRRQSRSDYGR